MPVFDFLKGTKSKASTTEEAAQDANARYEEINVDLIIPNPNQPRVIFDEEALDELAMSIEQVGLIQPLVVRPTSDGKFELVAGERRLRAVKILGWEKVACVVQNDMDTEDSALVALIENLQRENLNYMEEAQCYADLINTYSLTQEQLATRLGKSQSGIANKLRLLKLSVEVASAAYSANLSERHARELVRLNDDDEQLKMIDIIVEKGLSAKETEAAVSKRLDEMYGEGKKGVKPRPVIIKVMRDYSILMNTIKSATDILENSGFTVAIDRVDREDGIDVTIKVTNPRKQSN